MKLKMTLITLAAAFGLNFTGPINKATVDTQKSTVTWKAYKVTGSHEGFLSLNQGNLEMEDGTLVGGQFTLDMTSITVTDLEGEYKGKLEGHLHSEDFFNTAKFQVATLQITNVASRGIVGDYKVTADLTIKGITKAIKFNTKIAEIDGEQIATADLIVDRTDFDVRYGSGTFFSNLGDKTIYDEFEISVRLVIE